jgi:ATPase subunit of ABC transporter with duplicated ATPase domains
MTLDMSATPETVWALLQENARQIKRLRRSQKESYEQRKKEDERRKEEDEQRWKKAEEERRKEDEQRRKEVEEERKEAAKRSKKIDKQLDKLDKQIVGVHKSLGALIETLMAGRLEQKFPQYNFTRSFQRIKIFDKNKKPVTEIDILLSDDEWSMAVEVKREPVKDDIDHHLKRMKLMREYHLNEIKGKKLLGAMAGGVVSLEVREYAQKAGLFVLELNGEQVSLLASPEGFVPLEE